jgi:hypothetical protein
MQHRLLRILALVFFVSTLANAGVVFSGSFTGAFDPANWTLTNNNGGDGYQVVNSPTSVSVFGADNGVGPNITTFWITSPASGTVDVDWLYNTYDCCGSEWDPAGYEINGVTSQLSVSNGNPGVSQTGEISFSVNAGDTFGFYVYSADSILGRGEITITPGSSVIPEPSTVGYLTTGLVALWFGRRRWFTR